MNLIQELKLHFIVARQNYLYICSWFGGGGGGGGGERVCVIGQWVSEL